MENPYLTGSIHDTETAIMLEQANIYDIGNAVAFTDGKRIFLNTDENLKRILPAYDDILMKKWLLWHERMHLELRHHDRFFKYVDDLTQEDLIDEFHVTKDEVNIIMDILVHDWMEKKFPELVETAVNNCAQLRNRNSLEYTFTTSTLEEMLEEYAKHKKGEDGKDGEGEGEGESEDSKKSEGGEDAPPEGGDGKEDKAKKKPHAKSTDSETDEGKESKPEEGEPEMNDGAAPKSEHDKTDWTKLEKIDNKEFIKEIEGDYLMDKINRLKRKQFKLVKLTETLNGLVATEKVRTYKVPNYAQTGQRTILKGSKKGKASLYLCFDASGSMGEEMETFKEIISKSIPQAMQTTTEWFSGRATESLRTKCTNKEGRSYDYYKGQFRDFMEVCASSGYDDDGDRTIELCYLAEQKGYTPIGITDGGGQISWSKDMLKQLKRTVLVGQNERWLARAKEINPKIQTLDI